MRYAAFIFVTVACFASLLGAQSGNDSISTAKAANRSKARAILTPIPDYPLEARQHGWVGDGVILLEIDRVTGIVKSAKLLQSTGHKILDDAALKGYSRWRFRPGLSKAKVPFTYSLDSALYERAPRPKRAQTLRKVDSTSEWMSEF